MTVLRRIASSLAIGLGIWLAIKLLGGNSFDPTRAALVVALIAMLCLIGVGFGVREAVRIERRRKANLDIWLNH